MRQLLTAIFLLGSFCASAQTTCYGSGSDSLSFNLVQTIATCNDSCNGESAVIILAGSGNYSYLWSTGGTDSTETGLCNPDTVVVTVTDIGFGITCSDTLIISVPGISWVLEVNDVTINGACNGSAELTSIVGGFPPYNIVWYTAPPPAVIPGEDSTLLDSLCPGIYGFTIFDSGGCPGSPGSGNGGCDSIFVDTLPNGDSLFIDPCNGSGAYGGWIYWFSISEPDPLTLNLDFQLDPTCEFLCDGMIQVSANGGIPPYTYSIDPPWAPSNSSGVFQWLCGNMTYTITVTDSAGATADVFVTLMDPFPLDPQTIVTHETCLGACDGVVDVFPTGGTPPWYYGECWTGFGPNNQFPNLCPGNYCFEVIDANGCTDTVHATVLPGSYVVIDSTPVVEESSAGAADGSIEVFVSGPAPPFLYSINGGPYQSDSLFTGLTAGIYILCVQDANGCTTCDTVVLSASACGLTLSVVSTVDALCSGDCSGEAIVSVTGANGPANVNWYEVGVNYVATGDTALGLCPEYHMITAVDSLGCADTIGLWISAPPPLVFTGAVTNVDCFLDCNGQINTTTTGGIPPYQYTWNGGGTPTSPNNIQLCAGTYTGAVVDSNGCVTVESFTVTEPPQLVVQANFTDETCPGACDGSVVISASGGTPAYTYHLDCGLTALLDSTWVGLCSGFQCATVIDANGCQTDVMDTVQTSGGVSLDSVLTMAETSPGNGDGTIQGYGSGNGSLSYSLDSSLTNGTGLFTDLTSGWYYLCVLDTLGCEDCDSVFVDNGTGISHGHLLDFNLYPNPSNGMVTIQLNQSYSHIHLRLYDRLGKLLTSQRLDAGNYWQIDLNRARNLSAGMYLLTLQTSNETINLKIQIE